MPHATCHMLNAKANVKMTFDIGACALLQAAACCWCSVNVNVNAKPKPQPKPTKNEEGKCCGCGCLLAVDRRQTTKENGKGDGARCGWWTWPGLVGI